MLTSSTHWIWDSWYIKEGDTYHAFYLMAPRSLGDPNLRHINARVGHSTSRDLRIWNFVGEAFAPRAHGFDSQAIWTGSIIKHNNLFYYFYTGLDFSEQKYIQSVGLATSQDLETFNRTSDHPILRANPAHYATSIGRIDEPFRDPWVFFYNNQWHMFVTASRAHDTSKNQGVVAHATSDDLITWHDQGAIIDNVGMGQIEVTQMVEIDGQWFLIFCNHPGEMANPRDGFVAGTYSVPAQSPLGPFDFTKLALISHHYAGRVLFDPDNHPVLMGFLNEDDSGEFIGAIDDPIRLEVTSELALRPTR